MSLINTELVRTNPRLDGLDRDGLKDLIKQAKEALNPCYKISDDYRVIGNAMLFAEDHTSGDYNHLPQEGKDLVDEFGESWLYEICSHGFYGNDADDGADLNEVLKQYKFVKKHVDAFIKAAEEAKRRGADTIVCCNADNFHYNTVEGYEDA
jgi:hypothetical protein